MVFIYRVSEVKVKKNGINPKCVRNAYYRIIYYKTLKGVDSSRTLRCRKNGELCAKSKIWSIDNTVHESAKKNDKNLDKENKALAMKKVNELKNKRQEKTAQKREDKIRQERKELREQVKKVSSRWIAEMRGELKEEHTPHKERNSDEEDAYWREAFESSSDDEPPKKPQKKEKKKEPKKESSSDDASWAAVFDSSDDEPPKKSLALDNLKKLPLKEASPAKTKETPKGPIRKKVKHDTTPWKINQNVLRPLDNRNYMPNVKDFEEEYVEPSADFTMEPRTELSKLAMKKMEEKKQKEKQKQKEPIVIGDTSSSEDLPELTEYNDDDYRKPLYGLHKNSIESLNGTNWIDDDVVNKYIELLREAGVHKEYGLTNSHFMQKILGGFYKDADEWDEVKRMHTYPKFLIPHEKGDHWYLYIVDNKKKEIIQMDSFMKNVYTKEVNAIKNYLEHLGIDAKSYTVRKATGIPRQTNGYDCGAFLLEYARCIFNGDKMNFKQSDMPEVRKRIKNALTTY